MHHECSLTVLLLCVFRIGVGVGGWLPVTKCNHSSELAWNQHELRRSNVSWQSDFVSPYTLMSTVKNPTFSLTRNPQPCCPAAKGQP